VKDIDLLILDDAFVRRWPNSFFNHLVPNFGAPVQILMFPNMEYAVQGSDFGMEVTDQR